MLLFWARVYTVFARCLIFVLLARPSDAAPLKSMHTASDLGLSWSAEDNMPIVTLPYGRYKATSYDSARDIYTFRNIRFGAAPVGNLRWARAVPPSPIVGLQTGREGYSCKQILPRKGLNFLGSYNEYGVTSTLDGFIGTIGSIGWPWVTSSSEDCLFLDVHVPASVLRAPGSSKVPVFNWIYGGAYLLGSKDFLGGIYNGDHLITESANKMIFVSGNYRVGVYGFLNGPSVEREKTAYTNVGLHDQRAVLEWIQAYIHLFGGDKTQVAAAGESAGASSLLHHLIAYGGKQDPLFRRAIIQSPAFQPMGDRRPEGMTEKTFQKVAAYAGCQGRGIACLRNAPASALDSANQKVQESSPRGTFGLGVAADGSWVRQFAAADLLQGNVYPIESIIVSNTAHEGYIFADGHIRSAQEFNDFIKELFGDIATSSGLLEQVQQYYPPVSTGKATARYSTEVERLMQFVQDAAFTCNTRFLAKAYAGKTWSYQYNETAGWHGTDILATYYRTGLPFNLPFAFDGFARRFQSYLVSYATTGDPNTSPAKSPNTNRIAFTPWPKLGRMAMWGENIRGVLLAQNDGFTIGDNTVAPKDRCDFLQNFQADVMKKMNLAPGTPGYVTMQPAVGLDPPPPTPYVKA